MESFRGLKLPRLDNFMALEFYKKILHWRVIRFEGPKMIQFESLKALKLLNLATGAI